MQIIGLTMAVALAVAASSQIGAAQHRVSSTSSRSPAEPTAEAVFAKEASKVVFLVASKSGVPYKYASGIILTSDGYIVTNYHALQGADSLEVRYFRDPSNAQHYESFNDAKVLFESADQDIAVLKVGADDLPFAVCAAKGCEAKIGEAAFAIGNPDELSNSISSGIVAGVRAYSGEDFIQHTAPISHGSSGGALFDSRGHLLGMNTSMMTDGQNLNFAIASRHLLSALQAARRTIASLDFPEEFVSSTTESAQNARGGAVSKQANSHLDDSMSRLDLSLAAWRAAFIPESNSFQELKGKVLAAKPALDRAHAQWDGSKHYFEDITEPDQCKRSSKRFVSSFDGYLLIEDQLFTVIQSVDPHAATVETDWANANALYLKLQSLEGAALNQVQEALSVSETACKAK